MDQSELFLEYKSLLFSIAYNMLGVIEDAEDMVQETFLKWNALDADTVKHPKAFLVKIITNLSINRLNSAYTTREQYVGLWLPEPLVKENAKDSFKSIEMYHSLSIGMMVLLEKLTAPERAVFLLKEVFSYDYAEVAEIISKSEDNCRQIFNRAKKRLGGSEKRFQIDIKVHEKLLRQFLTALDDGNMEDFIGLLREDIELIADGGGRTYAFGEEKVTAIRQALVGPKSVSKFILSISERIGRAVSNRETKIAYVNGLPSAVISADNKPYCVLCLEIYDNKITNIYVQSNPDKIKHV